MHTETIYLIPENYIVRDGNAFYTVPGSDVLFAAPLARGGKPQWHETCEVDGSADTDNRWIRGLLTVLNGR